MATSLRASYTGIEIIDRARKMKGWTKTATLWSQPEKTDTIISIASLKRFWRRVPIDRDTFIEICQRVGVRDWESIVDNTPIPQITLKPDFSAYDAYWVGREKQISELSKKIHESCRLLLILGLTGIGKTALAERLVEELQDWLDGDWNKKLQRRNFDHQARSTEFASTASCWLEEWGETILPQDNHPEILLERLIKYLCSHRSLILIDSLEHLLSGNETEGWGNFVDEWWEKFFLRILSAESCQSRIIVTSQELPAKILSSRYRNFWHRQVLYGLDESEQETLFQITGLDVDLNYSLERSILLRLGKAYKGHPLVLRVIIGEIWESFDGNVQAYWNDVSNKIEEVEKALLEAEHGQILGEKDEWELHKLTRQVREQVNKQRLEAVFDRLEKQVEDAYIMLCMASVYRFPVQQEGWQVQLVAYIKRLANQDCSQERQERAIEELSNRYLAEESVNHNNKRVLEQHNLVRSLALEHQKKLLETSNI